ncbi:MAG: hypothetical protein M3R55_12370, partial [Acidobacteriota bacterium]|nr:hypothetical protein [Acidobacteriota bacterium]
WWEARRPREAGGAGYVSNGRHERYDQQLSLQSPQPKVHAATSQWTQKQFVKQSPSRSPRATSAPMPHSFEQGGRCCALMSAAAHAISTIKPTINIRRLRIEPPWAR